MDDDSGIDVDTARWEVFDYLQENLLHDKNIVATVCAEEFPPTLNVRTRNRGSFDMPIDVLTDDYDVSEMTKPLREGGSDMSDVLEAVKTCLMGWKFVVKGSVQRVYDHNTGPGIYFENDMGIKFMVGISEMPTL